MKIVVAGLWHLGLVTAACLAAEGHDVSAVDAADVVTPIADGRLPIDEPGLADLVAANRVTGRLRFMTDAAQARGAELIWMCYDTPVDDEDRADVPWVIERIHAFLDAFTQPAVVVVSSQLPVGTIARLAVHYPDGRFHFACIPENLRLGSAIEYFRHPDRFVVGTSDSFARSVVERALSGFAPLLVWTSIESAEVTKHAINAFLATSVVFANEIAALCERVGADAREVERGLKTDVRIGSRAYVRAGEAFAGGTLARDLEFLAQLGQRESVALAQLRATALSNERHRGWVFEQLVEAAGTLEECCIAILGLVYKPGTDTLRASNAVAIARKLGAAGAHVRGFDPAIAVGDARLAGLVELAASAHAALAGADVAIVATSWPEFREIPASAFSALTQRLVIDEARFLDRELSGIAELRYIAFGRPTPGVPLAS